MDPNMDPTKNTLAANPSGAPPNFTNPPSLANTTYGLVSTLIVITFVVVGLRILSAYNKKNSLKVDDYCCVLGLIFTTGYGILIMLSNKTARHAWDTPISFLDASWFKKNAAACIIYAPAMFTAKAAVVTLYLRVFNAVHWMRWTCWGLLIFMACLYGVSIPVYAVYMFPYGSNETWGFSIAAKAAKVDVFSIVTASFNVLIDIILLAIPVPIIMKLNLSFKKRLGLSIVFLTGIIATVATTLGLYYRVSVYMAKAEAGGDPTWTAAATYLTVLVELYTAVIVSCAPGCVSSWRNVLRETAVMTTLRSLITSTRSSLSRSRQSSQNRGNTVKDPSQESQEDLHSPSSIELRERELRDHTSGDRGITKTTRIQHNQV